jgi:HAMP domain-containing protein
MGEIQANTNRTLLLCGITFVLAIASGLGTTRLIARPIRRLSQASEALAQGEWQENLSEENAIAELQTLSISFTALVITVRDSRILSLPYLPFRFCPRWISKTL